LGKNSRNSLVSWAARLLLGARTIVGRWARAITPAMVNDLPDPVIPSNV
jgi:hypothetical protein